MADESIALVIPAFNEAKRIGAALDALAAFNRRQRLRLSVIVVDDGSDDGTADAALDRVGGPERLDVLSLPGNAGKGAAIRAGVLAAGADVIGFTDADLSTPLEELPRLVAPLRSGYDLAIASRARPESRILVPQPAYRRAGSKIFNVLLRSIGGVYGIPDTQCGFKFYRRDVAHDLYAAAVIDRWMFDLEILKLARHRGYRIAQVPVQWRNDADSRLRVTLDTYRMLRDLLRIRLRFWRDAYGPSAART